MVARDGGWKRHLGKLIIALTGLATVAGHWLVTVTHERETKDLVETALSEKMRGLESDRYEQKLTREREFSRKEETAKELEKVARQMDRTADQVEDLSERVNQLEGYLRARDHQRDRDTQTFWRTVNRRRK